MKPEVVEALTKSIAKWEKNARVRNVERATTGANDCPLCLMFNEEYRKDGLGHCVGCPVMVATGQDSCYGSPYQEASQAKRVGASEFRAAAKDEVAFLRSLLPDGEAK